MSELGPSPDVVALQSRIISFLRAFGRHKPDQTPCGQQVPVSEAHTLGDSGSRPRRGAADETR